MGLRPLLRPAMNRMLVVELAMQGRVLGGAIQGQLGQRRQQTERRRGEGRY